MPLFPSHSPRPTKAIRANPHTLSLHGTFEPEFGPRALPPHVPTRARDPLHGQLPKAPRLSHFRFHTSTSPTRGHGGCDALTSVSRLSSPNHQAFAFPNSQKQASSKGKPPPAQDKLAFPSDLPLRARRPPSSHPTCTLRPPTTTLATPSALRSHPSPIARTRTRGRPRRTPDLRRSCRNGQLSRIRAGRRARRLARRMPSYGPRCFCAPSRCLGAKTGLGTIRYTAVPGTPIKTVAATTM